MGAGRARLAERGNRVLIVGQPAERHGDSGKVCHGVWSGIRAAACHRDDPEHRPGVVAFGGRVRDPEAELRAVRREVQHAVFVSFLVEGRLQVPFRLGAQRRQQPKRPVIAVLVVLLTEERDRLPVWRNSTTSSCSPPAALTDQMPSLSRASEPKKTRDPSGDQKGSWQ